MLVSEAIESIEMLSDEMYEAEEWMQLINLCLDDLTPVAKRLAIVENVSAVVSNGKAEIDIENTDFNTVHEILNLRYCPDGGAFTKLRRLSPSNSFSKGWKQIYGKIELQGLEEETTGIVEADIYEKLPHVTDATDDIPLPEEHAHLVVEYVCAKAKVREEEPEMEQGFWGRYMQNKQEFASERLWQMEPQSRKFIRRSYLNPPRAEG